MENREMTDPRTPSLAIRTGDPAFDPRAPISVNGFRFVPEAELIAARADAENGRCEGYAAGRRDAA
jgi:hypothetical protein